LKNIIIILVKNKLAAWISIICLLCLFVNDVVAQAEVQPWGNVTGIRKHGQLFDFETAISVVSANGKRMVSTALEKQQPHFKRDGRKQIIRTNIDSLFFNETVKDRLFGGVKVTLDISAHKDTAISAIFFSFLVSNTEFKSGQLRQLGVSGSNELETATGIEFNSPTKNISIKFDQPARVIIKRDTTPGKDNMLFYIVIHSGSVYKGDNLQRTFIINASGEIDRRPVNVAINTAKPGREFLGLGGNFRLQNPKNDPQVIDYCLQNMRVAYSRIEMPWRFWQPVKDVDPTAMADSGKMAIPVKKAMELAHRLDSMGIPIILSAWFPPNWAITGKMNFRPVKGVWGNPLNKDNMDAIYKSIADYILYLKNKYGVAVKLFSFNESDLGINIRLTAQDHDDFIKGCGAYFAAHDLKTKMLLGDNSDATSYKFIYPAMEDIEARPYIGAISFHSWRGWSTGTLEKWADAATKLNVPVLVGEGSIDAAAWNYPDIFQEQTYALQEINLYTRMLAICQPLSILQWQLTSDYSPLIGGGIFGNKQPLHPGQRFFNLKQLSITPPGLLAMPVSCDEANITCAAMGDNDKGIYTLHLVNNGAKRAINLNGLPDKVKTIRVYSTSKKEYMNDAGLVKVENGHAIFNAPAASYVTVITE
jgi:hypothetical protein